MFNRKLKARIEELEQRLKMKDYTNERMSEKMGRYVDKISDLERQLDKAVKEPEVIYGKRLVNLKFKALFNGFYQDTEFKTGLGKCGKTVTHLAVTQDARLLTIFQYHTDGSHKEFVYRASDIDGRIQKCFENVKLEGLEAEREKSKRKLARFNPRFHFPC